MFVVLQTGWSWVLIVIRRAAYRSRKSLIKWQVPDPFQRRIDAGLRDRLRCCGQQG